MTVGLPARTNGCWRVAVDPALACFHFGAHRGSGGVVALWSNRSASRRPWIRRADLGLATIPARRSSNLSGTLQVQADIDVSLLLAGVDGRC
jgi:hypothetical protein